MSILSKIQALITAANNTTGESDATLTDAVQTLVDGYGQGGDYTGLEILAYNSNGSVIEANWHGDLPRGAFIYWWYNYTPVPVHLVDHPTNIPYAAFQNSYVHPDIQTLDAVEKVDSYAFTHSSSVGNSFREAVLSLPNFTGSGFQEYNPHSRFRNSNAYYYGAFYFPKMQRICDFDWYQNSVPDIQIQMGSVGYPVTRCGQRPFGSSTGSGTITVYTTGALLDTIKTAIQNQASASYTWIYKAAEATEYGGVSYAAGDTMLTVGGS